MHRRPGHRLDRRVEPNTTPSSAQRLAAHGLCWENVPDTGLPKYRPDTWALPACGPAGIIGHMMPRGMGANGFLAASSSRQAALACGCVPPTGSQVSVHRCGLAPGRVWTTTVSATLAAGAAWRWLGAELTAAAEPLLPALPQAATASRLSTAGSR